MNVGDYTEKMAEFKLGESISDTAFGASSFEISNRGDAADAGDLMASVMKRRLGNGKSSEQDESVCKRRKLEPGNIINKDLNADFKDTSKPEVDASLENRSDNVKCEIEVNQAVIGEFKVTDKATEKREPESNRPDDHITQSSKPSKSMSNDNSDTKELETENANVNHEKKTTVNEITKNVLESDSENDSIPFAITCFQSLNAAVDDDSVDAAPVMNTNVPNERADVTTPELNHSESEDESRSKPPVDFSGGIFGKHKTDNGKGKNENDIGVVGGLDDDVKGSFEEEKQKDFIESVTDIEHDLISESQSDTNNMEKPRTSVVPNTKAMVNDAADTMKPDKCDTDVAIDTKVAKCLNNEESQNIDSVKNLNGKETKNKVEIANETDSRGNQDDEGMMRDNDDSANTVADKVKSETKKSRKQTVPKRVMMFASDDLTAEESESNGDIHKHEKSRKQAMPKKVNKVEKLNELENGNRISNSNGIEVGDMETEESFTEGRGVPYEQWENTNPDSETDKSNLDETAEIPGAINDAAVDNTEYLLNQFRAANAMTFMGPMASGSFSQNSDILNQDLFSKLSPGMLTPHAASGLSYGSPNDLLMNIDVIRQLREIRCTKYRKISVAEKREIAEYARSYGVSQAAGIYNVSKSAVSMWTRMDLDELEALDGKRKKNCMLGNERFEKLCAKVREERWNKYKGLSKEDKQEVSKYAKLVGVREMSRCLDIALGTVSGWMRQFPYKVDDVTFDGDCDSKGSDSVDITESKGGDSKDRNFSKVKEKVKDTGKGKVTGKVKGIKTEHKDDYGRTEEMDGTVKEVVKIAKGENTHKDINEPNAAVNISMNESKDEVDHLIAENLFKAPDVDELFNKNKHLIEGTELEQDTEFRTLFARVAQCKPQKYKSLSAADKMSVCLYGRRFGVRKIGKVMGLATGTLSGWNTKYQVYLNSNGSLPSLNTSVSGSSDMESSMDSSDALNASSTSGSQSSLTSAIKSATAMESDNSEVMAVKCLLKDQFDELLEKVKIARTMKFKNITNAEKIHIVKCSKLVGIRPTARVLNVPIGTLTGWISKYSQNLHPVYNINDEERSIFRDSPYNYSSSLLPHQEFQAGAGSSLPGALIPNPELSMLNPELLKMGLFNGIPGLGLSGDGDVSRNGGLSGNDFLNGKFDLSANNSESNSLDSSIAETDMLYDTNGLPKGVKVKTEKD